MALALYPLYGVLVSALLIPRHPLVTIPVILLLRWFEDRWVGAPRQHLLLKIVLEAVAAAGYLILLPRILDAALVSAALSSQVISRAAMIVLAAVSRPGPRIFGLSERMRRTNALVAIGTGLAAVALVPFGLMLLVVLGCYAIGRMAQMAAYRAVGGVDGDSLGAARAGCELLVLAMFAFAI